MIKKIEMKTLLDTTRSRNIEIFLPTFPYSLGKLTGNLDKQLNVVTETSDLALDHIIALKRFVCTRILDSKTSNGEAYGPGEGWMEGTQDNEAQHCMTHNAALCYC